MRSGDTVNVYGTVMDGNGMTHRRHCSFIIFDSIAPVVTPDQASSPADAEVEGAHRFRPLDGLGFVGLVTVGYEVLSSSTERSATRYTVSQSSTTGRREVSDAFLADFDTLAPGSYLIRARAIDATGILSVSDTVRFNIADAIPPVLTFTSPAQRNPLLIGDSIDVTMRVTDNVALKRLQLRGFSVRGDPRLGATDTIMLYDSVLQLHQRSRPTPPSPAPSLQQDADDRAGHGRLLPRHPHATSRANADTTILTLILVSARRSPSSPTARPGRRRT